MTEALIERLRDGVNSIVGVSVGLSDDVGDCDRDSAKQKSVTESELESVGAAETGKETDVESEGLDDRYARQKVFWLHWAPPIVSRTSSHLAFRSRRQNTDADVDADALIDWLEDKDRDRDLLEDSDTDHVIVVEPLPDNVTSGVVLGDSDVLSDLVTVTL